MRTFAEFLTLNSTAYSNTSRFKQKVMDFVLDRYYSGIKIGTPVPHFVSANDDVVVIGYFGDSPRCVVVDKTADDPRNCEWVVYRGKPKAITQAIRDGFCGDYEGTAITPDEAIGILKKYGPTAPKQETSDEDYDL